MKVLALLAGCALLEAVAVTAQTDSTWENVPLRRLLLTVTDYAEQHPRDAHALYTLARLHGISYACSSSDVPLRVELRDWRTGKLLDVPEFSPRDTVLAKRDRPWRAPSFAALDHLTLAVRLYRRALALEGSNSLTQLGCAWMLEQGAPYAALIGPAGGFGGGEPKAWRTEALRLYRAVYAREMPKDLQSQMRTTERPDEMMGYEAGLGIVRLVGPSPGTDAGRDELARVRKDLQGVEAMPEGKS